MLKSKFLQNIRQIFNERRTNERMNEHTAHMSYSHIKFSIYLHTQNILEEKKGKQTGEIIPTKTHVYKHMQLG